MPENLKTETALLAQLFEAVKRPMTSEEVRRQRLSFVYGNLPADSTLTKHQVAAALDRLDGDTTIVP